VYILILWFFENTFHNGIVLALAAESKFLLPATIYSNYKLRKIALQNLFAVLSFYADQAIR
jgi:nitrate reductase gamma subunit